MRGNSVLLSFPRQPEFYLLQKHSHSQVEIVWLENHIVGAEAFEVGAWLLHLEHVFGARVRHFPAVPRHFPTSPNKKKKMVARTSPLLSLGVCTCAFVCIFVCWKTEKTWRRRIPPKKFKSEHAVVVAMLIFYFLNFFFIYHCFTSKSNISSAFHMYLFTFLR